jgi:maltooligosyltrehalose trehalohydrolase
MLFQGQEFSASSPFLFFADHNPELAKLVKEGRAGFLSQFPSIALPELQSELPDPADSATFERCKLDLTERAKHAETYTLTRDLLRLRRHDATLRAPRRGDFDGAVLGPESLVLRFFGDDDDRLLVVNLGRDLVLVQTAEPLLAAPADCCWRTIWSSEDPRYGGHGAPPLETDDGWRVPGHCAVLLGPGPDTGPMAATGV